MINLKSSVAVLVILVLLAIGYFILDRKSIKGSFPTASVNASTSTTNLSLNKETNPHTKTGWLLFESKEFDFKLEYPEFYEMGKYESSPIGRWLSLRFLYIDPHDREFFAIYVEQMKPPAGGFNCHFGLCDKPVLKKVLFDKIEWDYLGFTSYGDGDGSGGGVTIQPATYRMIRGPHVYYASFETEKHAKEILSTFKFISSNN